MSTPKLRLLILAPLPLVSLGLCLVWLAERSLVGVGRKGVLLLACGVVAAAVAIGLLRIAFARRSRRHAYVWLLRCYVGQAWALGLYALCQTATLQAWPNVLQLVQVLWPGLLLFYYLPAFMLEYAVASMRHAPTLEIGRVALAARAARLTWMVLVTFAAANYAGNAFSYKVDLSYLHTTEVGPATASLVTSTAQPMRFVLFMPPGNDVAERVEAYLKNLAALSPQVELELLDQALNGERAQTLGVTSNGVLVLEAGSKVEKLTLPLDFEEARRTLRSLDGEVLTRLLGVLRPARLAYLTSGHLERTYVPGSQSDAKSLHAFKRLLEGQGYVVRRLGLSEGLGQKVPEDAEVVAVMGPAEGFGPQEVTSLQRYANEGGRLLLALDNLTSTRGPSDSLAPLLAALGLQVGQAPLANEHFLVRLEGQAQSVYNLVTSQAGNHPAVATLRKNAGRMALVLPGAVAVSHLSPAEAATRALRPSALLWTMPGTWVDNNRNGKQDPSETSDSDPYALAVAVARTLPLADATALAPGKLATTPEMRAVVLGDVDFASNAALTNPGNAYFVLDALHWLTGDEGLQSVVATEQDPPLLHRKADDVLWFYGVTYGVPALVLLGAVFAGRRGRAVRASQSPASRPRAGEGEELG